MKHHPTVTQKFHQHPNAFIQSNEHHKHEQETMPLGDVKAFAVTAEAAFSSPNNRRASPCLCRVMTQAETVTGTTKEYEYSPVPLQYGSGEAVTALYHYILCESLHNTTEEPAQLLWLWNISSTGTLAHFELCSSKLTIPSGQHMFVSEYHSHLPSFSQHLLGPIAITDLQTSLFSFCILHPIHKKMSLMTKLLLCCSWCLKSIFVSLSDSSSFFFWNLA